MAVVERLKKESMYRVTAKKVAIVESWKWRFDFIYNNLGHKKWQKWDVFLKSLTW